MNKHIHVLYIDDEKANLTTFHSNFRRSYTVYTAPSASEAFAILEQHPIHIIIADQRMPNMTGVEFFNIVQVKYPKPIRVLLTGFADINVIVDAINKGAVFRYIAKPWDDLEIHNAIQTGYELYSTKDELEQKMIELQKTNNELNRFIYSASHDIRSPLTSALSVIELARASKDKKDPAEYLNMIEECVLRVDRLIKKIIEYYKNLRADEEPKNMIDFKTIVQESIELCQAQNPKIQFHVNINQPLLFVNDVFRLSVVINNLVSNAVKYQKPETNDPAVWITADINEREAHVIIKDNGIGIPQEHLDDIFKMFFRHNTVVTGTGIGLFVVKEAVHKLGGSIEVQSTVDEGTTFDLRIPNRAEAKQ